MKRIQLGDLVCTDPEPDVTKEELDIGMVVQQRARSHYKIWFFKGDDDIEWYSSVHVLLWRERYLKLEEK